MHKVFINNKPLIFDEIYGKPKDMKNHLLILSDSSYSVDDAIKRMETENNQGILFLSANPDLSWNEFTSKFTLVEAAGGLVKNENDEILAIFRKKFWDLPKGKLDYDETPENAAVREVKEECGVKNLELNSFLMKTFHIYSEKKKEILKKTHWFIMTGDSKEKLKPQVEEKIEKAEWMSKEKIIQKFFPLTYISIKEVLEKYFQSVQTL
jgi:8-oxo-dGTP pyrophosphatase MutT (NUDIX family)